MARKYKHLIIDTKLKRVVDRNIYKELMNDSNIVNFANAVANISNLFELKYLLALQWVVYILKCNDNTLYTGITNDLFKRIRTHNNRSGAKYTKSRTPVKFYWAKTVNSKSEALKLEYEIKQMSRIQKLNLSNINTHNWKKISIDINLELIDQKSDIWICSKCRTTCLTEFRSKAPTEGVLTYPLEFHNCEEKQVAYVLEK